MMAVHVLHFGRNLGWADVEAAPGLLGFLGAAGWTAPLRRASQARKWLRGLPRGLWEGLK